MLQCVAVCCSVLQCVAVCCSVYAMRCTFFLAVCYGSVLQSFTYVLVSTPSSVPSESQVPVCCSVLQCGAVCCSVL